MMTGSRVVCAMRCYPPPPPSINHSGTKCWNTTYFARSQHVKYSSLVPWWILRAFRHAQQLLSGFWSPAPSTSPSTIYVKSWTFHANPPNAFFSSFWWKELIIALHVTVYTTTAKSAIPENCPLPRKIPQCSWEDAKVKSFLLIPQHHLHTLQSGYLSSQYCCIFPDCTGINCKRRIPFIPCC